MKDNNSEGMMSFNFIPKRKLGTYSRDKFMTRSLDLQCLGCHENFLILSSIKNILKASVLL